MTVICGIHREGVTWLGGDSRTTFGSLIFDHSRKLMLSEDGKWAVATAGLTRLDHILRRLGNDLFLRPDPFVIADTVRREIKEDGWKDREEDGEGPSWVLGAIIAAPGALWGLCSDLTILPIPEGVFWADGSGERFSFGAAHALRDRPPEEIVRGALDAAVTYDNGCGGEPWIHRLG